MLDLQPGFGMVAVVSGGRTLRSSAWVAAASRPRLSARLRLGRPSPVRIEGGCL